MNDLAHKKIRWRFWILAAIILPFSCAAILGFMRWQAAQRPAESRLALTATYPEMPADRHHRYINLPLDYGKPDAGSYRGFYILSPNFKSDGPVVFILTDGQMELVAPGMSSAFFDEQLPGLSYVLIGHRGHSPAEFPEIFRNGRLDMVRAMKLYGSWQRVEDIERVRQDMTARKLLPLNGKIMIFGASGAGVLAQQYLSRYGEHVERAMLVSTGAPDLARQNGWTCARRLEDADPLAAKALTKAATSGDTALAYMLFQLGREGQGGLKKARKLSQGGSLTRFGYALYPSLNWSLARISLSLPAATAAKVRMYELLGPDLLTQPANNYDPPLFPWSRELLADFLRQRPPLPDLRLDRQGYAGEVLVISGKQDVVFSPEIGRAIAEAYPNGAFLLARGGHRLELDRPYHQAIRKAFFRSGLHSLETEALMRMLLAK